MTPLKPLGHYYDLERIRDDVSRAINLFGFEKFGQMFALVHPGADDQDVYRDAYSRRNWPAGRRMSDFHVFNTQMMGGPLHQMWEDLRRLYPVARMRIAAIERNRCYSVHNDEEIRLHYAVVTNPKCLFVISDRPRDEKNMPVYPNKFHVELPEFRTYHLPDDGQVYQLDGNHVHTALNGGTESRIHVVIETISALNDRVSDGRS